MVIRVKTQSLPENEREWERNKQSGSDNRKNNEEKVWKKWEKEEENVDKDDYKEFKWTVRTISRDRDR